MSNEQWAMSDNLFCSSLTAHCSLVEPRMGLGLGLLPVFPFQNCKGVSFFRCAVGHSRRRSGCLNLRTYVGWTRDAGGGAGAGFSRRPQFSAGETSPEHLRIGMRGEDEAYFQLRRMGYVIVARNFRSPRCHGEIDLIGWEGDTLCFIEVKTRTSHDVKTAEAAVDRHKRREVAEVAREYLKRLPVSCQWRFDFVSVYYVGRTSRPQIEIFRNASLAS